MRGLLLLVVATASAQDHRGFVNQRLVTQNFVKNSLNAAKAQLPRIGVDSIPCAIPLLQVTPRQDVDKEMVITPRGAIDPKMILPTVPVCPAK